MATVPLGEILAALGERFADVSLEKDNREKILLLPVNGCAKLSLAPMSGNHHGWPHEREVL